jgi:S-(hydroxymethyl)glutathione dehydrogenase/alcohol dehydrogenase
MRAAVVDESGALAIEEIPRPAPKPGEVLVQVAGCGICHSDLHVLNGDIAFPRPCTLGHEVSGTVTGVGAGVDGLAPGQTVVGSFIMPCGTCRHCARGRDDMCERFFSMNRGRGVLYDGTTRLARADGTPIWMYSMGGLAEYCVSPATAVFPIEVDDLVSAAVIGCALFTGYGAVRHGADLRAGETAVVVGVGGVGLNIVQVAAAHGAARVIAVDLDDLKLAAAGSMGATDLVNASGEDAVAIVRKVAGGAGADVAFDAVGSSATFEQAVQMVADGGRMVAVGLTAATATAAVPINHLVRRGISLRGSYGARTRSDMPAIISMVADGRVRVDGLISQRVPLHAALETYRALDRREIIGRAVVDMSLT